MCKIRFFMLIQNATSISTFVIDICMMHGAWDVTVIPDTAWCRYNAFNFLPNIHKRHPIAHPLG